jgi:formylglycine-generating enzyme required for sulfatase activity
MKILHPKIALFLIISASLGTIFTFSLDSSPSSFIGLKGHKIRLVHVPDGWISIPEKPPSAGVLPDLQSIPGFWMTRAEVQVQTFCQFLSIYPEMAAPYSSQVTRCRGQVRPLPGFLRKPITQVSVADAELFCHWLSRYSKRTCRLPTPSEWLHMARSGHPGSRYPWGWESASKRAGFQLTAPQVTGLYGPFGQGFVDVIGNVYEWSLDPMHNQAFIHGGAWSDRHEFSMNLYERYEQPPAHRSADIGFRILIERPSAEHRASLTSSSKAL